MLKFYIITLYNTILTSNILTIISIILFFSSCIILLFMIIVGILDSTYRPNSPQYPYNIFFDKICPMIIIISPTTIITYCNIMPNSFLNKSILILLIQTCICIPLMYYWSLIRNWNFESEHKSYSWNTPLMYLNLQLIIWYISFFFFLIFFLRYLRLGQDILIYPNIFIEILKDPVVFTLLLTPFTLGWLFILVYNISFLRKKAWENVIDFIHSIHIKFLKFNTYFFIMEIIYKLCFLWFTFIINETIIYRKKPSKGFRRMFHYIYLKSYLINLFMFIIVFIEFLFRNFHLYYSLYILFVVILIKNICYIMNRIACCHWSFDCCISDYLNFKLEKPRYPSYFWTHFHLIHDEYQFDYDITLIVDKKVKEKCKYRNIYQKTHDRLLEKSLKNGLMPFNARIKISYYNWSQIRWVHHQASIIKTTFHPLIGLFARSFPEKIILLNQAWHETYPLIQKNESLFPKYVSNNKNPIKENIAYPFKNISENFQKGIIDVSLLGELGALSWFTNVSKKLHFTATPYTKTIILDTKSQAQPDVVINLKDSLTLDQRTHGFDQKLKIHLQDSNSQILCGLYISKERYQILLQDNMRLIQANIVDITPELFVKLLAIHKNLGSFYSNFDLQLEYLLKNIHYFDKATGLSCYIPSLITKEPINIEALHPEIIADLPKCYHRLTIISNKLKEKNYTKADYKKAIELFSDSFIQKLLLEN